MTEQKIREAYGQHCCASGIVATVADFTLFKAGYIAMLNSLERAGGCGGMELYYLPNGVTRD
jgi:hypothetical protein